MQSGITILHNHSIKQLFWRCIFNKLKSKNSLNSDEDMSRAGNIVGSQGSELEQLEAFNAQYSVVKRGVKSRRAKRGKDGTELSDGIVNAMVDDLRRARLEQWCRKHGCKVKLELKDKIALRKWFYSLDSDNSGEVSAEELHDPMLSTGRQEPFDFDFGSLILHSIVIRMQ